MDAFESIIAQVLENDGYWVKQSVKVELTPNEKEYVGIGRTSPTPEIDLVAFKGNELILFEVKSFLDSDGVKLNGITGVDLVDAKKYKIINNEAYKSTILEKIKTSMHMSEHVKIKFGLAAGNIFERDRLSIINYFNNNSSLVLITPETIARKLIKFNHNVYINDAVTMTIKLLTNQNKIVVMPESHFNWGNIHVIFFCLEREVQAQLTEFARVGNPNIINLNGEYIARFSVHVCLSQQDLETVLNQIVETSGTKTLHFISHGNPSTPGILYNKSGDNFDLTSFFEKVDRSQIVMNLMQVCSQGTYHPKGYKHLITSNGLKLSFTPFDDAFELIYRGPTIAKQGLEKRGQYFFQY